MLLVSLVSLKAMSAQGNAILTIPTSNDPPQFIFLKPNGLRSSTIIITMNSMPSRERRLAIVHGPI
ncbi:hypothetical protein D3C73_1571200 [compost metagenome]